MKAQRLEYIDFAKGFAILSIVIFHYCRPYVSGIWSQIIMLGGMGVHLFFVLSGFGLGLSSQNTATHVFYRKRFVKILIPYYLIVLLIYIVNSICPMYHHSGLYALGGHLFFYKMFDENIIGSFGYHFWFISTLVQFYITFPLIVRIKKNTTIRKFLLISILISFFYWIIITMFQVSDKRIFNSFFLQYLWEFNVGIVMADLYLNRNMKPWENNVSVFFLLSIFGISAMGLMALKGGNFGRTFNDIPASLGYFSLSVVIYWLCQWKFQFFKSIFLYVGKLSYELYLLHMLVFLLLNDLFSKMTTQNSNILFSILLLLPLSILFAHFLRLVNIKLNEKISYRFN